MLTPKQKGDRWESLFAMMCGAFGIKAEPAGSPQDPYDFYCNGLRVQCKWLRPSDGRADQRIQITQGGTGSTKSYAMADVDVFAILIRHSVYIIPASAIPRDGDATQCRRTLSKHQYYPWQDRWSVLINPNEVPEVATDELDRLQYLSQRLGAESARLHEALRRFHIDTEGGENGESTT
jgi:hypothetical protein